MFANIANNMQQRLINKSELVTDLLLSFPIGCCCLTLGPGYLDALTETSVDIITSKMVQVDSSGIFTKDGQHHPAGMIVWATVLHANSMFSEREQWCTSFTDRWKKAPVTSMLTRLAG